MAKKRKGERADGLIQVSLDIGYWPDGRRRRKYFYGHTRDEANAKKAAYKQHQNSGSKFKQDITVSEWVDIFKSTYRENVDQAYIVNDNVPYNRLVSKLGRMRMVDVTEADLQNALNQVKGMSYSTCDKYKQAIKRVFERARKNKIIPDNPAEDLRLPPHVKGTHRALESWEVELILAHWNEQGVNAGLWVMLMLLCGLRRGEMMALDWSSIDMDGRTLKVKQTAVIATNQSEIVERAKSDAGIRVIPICGPLHDALSTVPVGSREGLVCLSAHSKQLSESAVTSGLKTFCRAMERIANGEPAIQRGKRTDLISDDSNRIKFSFRAHDLRHTFATFLYDAGTDVKAAQYFLGHADIRMTLDLYTHLSREREQASRNQAVEYLNQLLDSRVKNATPYGIIGQ